MRRFALCLWGALGVFAPTGAPAAADRLVPTEAERAEYAINSEISAFQEQEQWDRSARAIEAAATKIETPRGLSYLHMLRARQAEQGGDFHVASQYYAKGLSLAVQNNLMSADHALSSAETIARPYFFHGRISEMKQIFDALAQYGNDIGSWRIDDAKNVFHKDSGLTFPALVAGCPMLNIIIFSKSSNNDVSAHYKCDERLSISIYSSYYLPTTLVRAFSASEEVILKHREGAKRLRKPEKMYLTENPKQEIMAASYSIGSKLKPSYSELFMGIVNDWHIKIRLTDLTQPNESQFTTVDIANKLAWPQKIK